MMPKVSESLVIILVNQSSYLISDLFNNLLGFQVLTSKNFYCKGNEVYFQITAPAETWSFCYCEHVQLCDPE